MKKTKSDIVGIKRTNDKNIDLIEQIIDNANEFILMRAYNFNLPKTMLVKKKNLMNLIHS